MLSPHHLLIVVLRIYTLYKKSDDEWAFSSGTIGGSAGCYISVYNCIHSSELRKNFTIYMPTQNEKLYPTSSLHEKF